MKYLLGTKEEMTQIFDTTGKCFPATILLTGPMTVTQLKKKDKDGYDAIQIGFGEKRNRSKNNKKEGNKANNTYRYLREAKVSSGEVENFKVGDKLDQNSILPGDKVIVSGISKGKGFQGVVKRHGFHGGPRSHGQKHSEREPGSIGATGPQRVFKGKKMAGRMGGDTVTVKGLVVLSVEDSKIILSGAVPGRRGTLVEIKSQ